MPTIWAAWTRTAAQLLLSSAFVMGITVYSFKTFHNVAENAAELPKWNPLKWHYWKDFPETFQKFFEDRIAWKHLQVRRFARFKLNQLGVSPTPRVLLGEDGWLFYNFESESDHYFGLTDPRLAKRLGEWATALPEWHEWLQARGIRLQIVVPPNKQSVYPEYLPPLERKQIGPAPVDVLLGQLSLRDPNLPLLDLRDPLRQAKLQEQIYYKTDTHWNPRGLVHGYRATAKALGFQPLNDTRVQIASPGMNAADLPKLMGYWSAGPEPFSHYEIVERQAAQIALTVDGADTSRLRYLDSRLYQHADSSRPRAVLFHDSFGDGMYGELLAEHFSRLLCLPTNHMDPELIAREKPDVVIFEIVERLFQGIGARRPTDPPRRSLTN